EPADAHSFPAFDLREWLSAGLHARVPSSNPEPELRGFACVPCQRIEHHREQRESCQGFVWPLTTRSSARHPREALHPCGGARRPREALQRCGGARRRAVLWTVRRRGSRLQLANTRQRVHFRSLWMVVDMWINGE